MKLTFLPLDGVDGVSGDGTGDDHHLTGHDGGFLHGPHERQAVNVETGRVFRVADFGGSDAPVQTSVVGVDGRDVQVGHDFGRNGAVVAHLDAVPRQN